MQATNSIPVNISSALDLHPFGMPMPGRSYTSENYRFGFNGQEKNNDISGTDGGHLDFTYRIHDARLGRFLSVDPLHASYPWNSTYAFAENRVIDGIDLEGLEWESHTEKNKTTFTITLKVKNSAEISEDAVCNYVSAIAAQIEKSFSGVDEETGMQYETKVKIDFNSAINEETDFYLDLVNVVENRSSEYTGEVDRIGDTQINRIQVNVSKVDTEENGTEYLMRSGAHEIGHTGGLEHNLRYKNVDENNLPVEHNNLMRQTGQVDDNYKPLENSYINAEQLRKIDETISNNNSN